MTDFNKIESQAKTKLSPTLITPEIVNASVSMYPTCTSCKKRVTVPPGERRFSCESCHRRIVTKKLGVGFLGNLDVIDNGKTLTQVNINTSLTCLRPVDFCLPLRRNGSESIFLGTTSMRKVRILRRKVIFMLRVICFEHSLNNIAFMLLW